MEIKVQSASMIPRAAATVVLLRDVNDSMEVFMIKRHGLSDVLGGAYVFPGGKVDCADADADVLGRLGAPLESLHAALCEPDLGTSTAAGFFAAACRETFEEAGVLLASGISARQLDIAKSRARDGLRFGEILAQLDLQLDCSNVVPWARWITPKVPTLSNRRFDARFFLAAAPNDQEARHDNHEATESFWLRPRVVLERYWAGEINLAPAQIMSVAALARFRRAADVVAAARGCRPPMIQPESFTHKQLRAVAFPGDERHLLAERALPGPLFLVFRNDRFEPFDGFDALFA